MTVSDMIDSSIALISLMGVIAAWRAALSSKESAKVAADSTSEMQKQTDIMEQQLKHSRSAYLLPNEQVFSVPLQPIFYKTTEESENELDNHYGDLEVNLLNSGQGNAYHIESYFMISNFDVLKSVISFKKPLHKNTTLTEGYYLKFILEETRRRMKIGIHDPKSRFNYVEYGVAKYPSTKNVLQPKESFPVRMPSYFQAILLDAVHRHYDRITGFSTLPLPQFNLNVKFKEEDTITEDSYKEFMYEAYIKDLVFTDTHLNFSLYFRRVPLQTNPLINTEPHY